MRLLILLCIAFLSCQKQPNKSVLSGQLDDLKSKYLILNKSGDRYGYQEILAGIDTLEIAGDGKFRFEFDVEVPGFFQLTDDKGYAQTLDLYFRPGDSLNIVRQKVNNQFIHSYQGSLGGAYRYFAYHDSLRQNDPLFAYYSRDMYYWPEDSVKSVLKSQMQREIQVIDTLFGDQPEWKPVRQYASDQRHYENFEQYFRYLYYHNYYSNDTFLYLTADPSYYDFMQEVDLTYYPEQYQWQYNSFISRYVDDQVERRHKDLSDSLRWKQNLSLRFNVIKDDFSGKARDAALIGLSDEFSHSLEHDDFFQTLDIIENYLAETRTDESFLVKFRRIADTYKALEKGNTAPDIALPDINGDTIRLSDLKGKVLYVDFWGTWCFPCLQEMPHSLTLQEKFKDKNVEFVYIGLEGGEDQVKEWKEFISGQVSFDYAPFLEQRVYPGVHMLCEGQFGNPQIQAYQISAAPTYMLIDAEGKIARARAPRPSDKEIEALLNEMLTKG